MAVYAANLTTTDDRLRNLDHLSESVASHKFDMPTSTVDDTEGPSSEVES